MANKITLDGLSVDQLLDLRENIDARLTKLVDQELDDLQKRMDRLSNYKNNPSGPPGSRSKTKSSTGKTRSSKGRKAPIKFRDPKTGNAWSGRGLTPVWLREFEAEGGKRADLAV